MKKIISLILSILLYSQFTFADCLKPITYLETGATTQCSGFLFTKEAELENREKLVQYDYLVKINKKQDELVNILNDRTINLMKQVSLAEENGKFNTYVNIGFFVLGSLITGYIASNVNR